MIKLAELIIFENEEFIALNKPSGLLSIPDREGKELSLKKILQEKYNPVFTVHRLDRNTSGLIIFAKTETTHRHLSLLFEGRQMRKIYVGLVLGTPPKIKGSIDAPIAGHPTKKGLMVINRRGKESLTDYEILESFGIYSWMQFRIYTGRTHQIRIHMKNIGHPVACDELYGDGKPIFISSLKHGFKLSKYQEEEKPILNRLALHSLSLAFNDVSGKSFELEAPLPKDLRATLQQLAKRS